MDFGQPCEDLKLSTSPAPHHPVPPSPSSFPSSWASLSTPVPIPRGTAGFCVRTSLKFLTLNWVLKPHLYVYAVWEKWNSEENYCYIYWFRHKNNSNLFIYEKIFKNENSLYILTTKNGPKIDSTNVYEWKCPNFTLTDSCIIINYNTREFL